MIINIAKLIINAVSNFYYYYYHIIFIFTIIIIKLYI